MEEASLLERELFIVGQRLREAEMALVEAARQKDELRDTAAALMLEVRELRGRAGVAEGLARRAETERAAAEARLAERAREHDALVERLAEAQREYLVAHETNTERDLQIDSLHLQVMELRLALARARGLERA